MGKKDLLKSTTKKKKAKKKKTTAKKVAPKKVAPKKAAAKKAAPKKTAAKKTAPKKATAKKPAPRKKLTGKELLLQQFPVWKPAQLFTVQPDKDIEKQYSAPPFVDDSSKQTEISKLLALQFDIQVIIQKGEKAAAEKAAAEKAAAEKAAAEKAAAEKAAAEKAAAEKAAAEKAAAEKAAAEKAAAGKAAAGKAPAPAEPMVYQEEPAESDATPKILVTLAACLVIIFTPIIIASFLNTTNYYLKATDGALELWQGDFAPMGTSMVLTMPGAVPPETIKDEYTRKEVFPIVSGYLLQKADTMLEIQGIPNYPEIFTTLKQARTYAVTKPLKSTIEDRLIQIELMNLLYKADIAAASVDGQEDAIDFLEQAALLDLDAQETTMVQQKLQKLKKAD